MPSKLKGKVRDQLMNLVCNSPREFLDDALFIHDGGLVVDLKAKKCFEYYYQIGHVFKPKSILEIGVRYGYSLISIILGSKKVTYAEGWDTEEYVKGSNAIALEFILARVPKACKVQIQNIDSQKTLRLPRKYDLISIDGDHTQKGTYHDLCLTVNRSKVVVVDDYDFMGSVRRAVDQFYKDRNSIIQERIYLPSYRGTIVFVYKIPEKKL
jgi:hypothetical protein